MIMPFCHMFPVPGSEDVHWLNNDLYYEAHSKILVQRRGYPLY